jgi:hypothetical protein
MTDVANLQDHMAYSCQCGCVHFNLLKSGNIECVLCGKKITDSEWGLMPEINQKPVAWRWGVPKLKHGTFEWRYSVNKTRPDAIPLYTTPPQRAWVGLTEKDICEAAVKSQEGISPRDDTLRFAIAIEAKLKEKNNG